MTTERDLGIPSLERFPIGDVVAIPEIRKMVR
jgi:hypothetical protein